MGFFLGFFLFFGAFFIGNCSEMPKNGTILRQFGEMPKNDMAWGQVNGWTFCRAGDQNVKLHGLWANKCSEYPCQFNVGDSMEFAVEFTPTRNTEKYNLEMFVVFFVPISVYEEDFEGPYEAGKKYRVETSGTVPDKYTGTFKVRVKVKGDNKSDACIEMKVTIKNKDKEIKASLDKKLED